MRGSGYLTAQTFVLSSMICHCILKNNLREEIDGHSMQCKLCKPVVEGFKLKVVQVV